MLYASLLLILSSALFSGNFIAGKAITDSIPPFSLAFLRSTMAFLFILPLGFKEIKANKVLFQKEWKNLYCLSFTGIVMFTSLVYLAIQFTTTINAAIVEATTPVVAGLLGFLFLKERFSHSQIVGILLSLLGVIWIITKGSIGVIVMLNLNIGDVLMVIAVLSWAFYSIFVNKHNSKYPTYGGLSIMLLMASVTLAPFAAIEGMMTGPYAIDLPTIVGLLYVGIFPSIIAFIAWNKGVSLIGPSRASVFLNLIPVFTSIGAVLIINEKLTFTQLIGGVVVLMGVFLTTRTAREKRVKQLKL